MTQLILETLWEKLLTMPLGLQASGDSGMRIIEPGLLERPVGGRMTCEGWHFSFMAMAAHG